MGDDQDVAFRKALLDFFHDLQGATRDHNGWFASTRGGIPGGIRRPTDVIIVEVAVHFLGGFSLPGAILDLAQILAQFHFHAGGITEGLSGGDGATERAGVDGRPGNGFICLPKKAGHFAAILREFRVESGAAKGVVAAIIRLTVPEEIKFEAHAARVPLF